jgi:hypothetical protein
MPDHAPLPANPRRRAGLAHRQARESLALLLDPTTEPELAARLHQHVEGCARCQGDLEQLRQAEAWLLAQPVEVPQMTARQGAAWAAIQARIAAEDGSQPAAEKALANGHAPALANHADARQDLLVPLPASDGADAREEDRVYHPLPVPQPPAPVTISFPAFGKSGLLRPRTALFVALAASLIVGSFAALFLAHLSTTGLPSEADSTALFSMGVLDPGNETPAFSFDPVSRRLFALTGEISYGCPPGASCPYFGPPCLRFATLDVNTGKALGTIRPTCTPGENALNSTTFTDLLDDSARGEALLVGSDQQVTAVDNRSGAIVRTYALACCPDGYSQPEALLDQRDQLLLTTAQSDQYGTPGVLVAQNVTTGQVEYQAPLLQWAGFRAALVSDVTGWLYVWSECAMGSDTSCVAVYDADGGKKVGGWQAASQETPLAADPTENILYVRADQPDGQSETLVVDGHTGATVGQLPPAEAMAINAPLHHAYLLDDDGVTVVDTRTRRKLSTLPILAHDESWVAPAVDVATSRVYLPIQRGKLLMAQDDAAGQLRLRSTSLAVVLDAERAMTVDARRGDMALYPWELPIGPGSLPVYHPLSQGTPGSCGIGWVDARSTATATAQKGGQYTVQISLAWDNQFAQVTRTSTPASHSSYPHEHTWLYDVPASGGAQLSSEHGAPFSSCRA